jgi:RNA polymerase sigma-70 factor (ECF subfamily)
MRIRSIENGALPLAGIMRERHPVRPDRPQERADSDALVERMLALDEHAFREFAEIFGNRLRFLFMRHFLPVLAAEDLAVSCIANIALKLPSYRPGQGNFAQWVWTIAENELADYYRRARRDLPPAEGMAANREKEPGDSPEEATTAAVREALEQLDARDQEVIMLRAAGESTFDEIGKILGLSPGAVAARHHRALKRLETILEDDRRINMTTKGCGQHESRTS